MTYYVLPLISLSKFSFGPPENFINAYVNAEGTKVIVQVKSKELVYPQTIMHPDLELAEQNIYTFNIPNKLWLDVLKIMRGKYSRISEEAKGLIRLNSGLSYRMQAGIDENKQPILDTDARIAALDRDPSLREALEEMLGITIGDSEELISPPQDNEFWKP